MEDFKNRIFEDEHPGQKLVYQTLSKEESNKVIGDISQLVKADIVLNSKSFFRFFESVLTDGIALNEGDLAADAGLKTIFATANLDDTSQVFVIWSFDELVDTFSFYDLIKYWDYIWYGPSDEAVILFFPSSRFVLLITDWGNVNYKFF
jgi:hypothetical protein